MGVEMKRLLFSLLLIFQIFSFSNLFSIFSDEACSMFCQSARKGELEAVERALNDCCSDEERRYLVNWKDTLAKCESNKNNSSLVWGAMNSCEGIVAKLLEYANQESKDRALSIAVQRGRYDGIVKQLLNAGVKADSYDFCDQSPILKSVFKGNYKIFKILIGSLLETKNKRELINIFNKKDLHSKRNMLHIIVRKHPDAKKKNNDFQFETTERFNEFFGFFIRNCVCYLDFKQVDQDGFSVIHWLAKLQDTYSLDFIFRHIRKCNSFSGRHRYVRDLLRQKAENNSKNTPFDSAKQNLNYSNLDYKPWERGVSCSNIVDSESSETLDTLHKWLDWANRRECSRRCKRTLMYYDDDHEERKRSKRH